VREKAEDKPDSGGLDAGLRTTGTGPIFRSMRYYRTLREVDGSFTVYVNAIGTLPGRYSGFKSEEDAARWVAEQQKRPDLPPFSGSGI
jgi:hypothetical protein